MRQLDLVQVDISEVVQGMYVAELDRPWLDSPFLLEGFLLDELEQLEQLRALCRFVLVDVVRSRHSCRNELLARRSPAAVEIAAEPAALRRATASLVTQPIGEARARRNPAEQSFFADFRTIMSETLHGGEAAASEDGGRMWRGDAAAAGATAFTMPTSGDGRPAPVMVEEPGYADQGSPYIAGAQPIRSWDGRERRFLRRAPAAAPAGDDPDQAQLGGAPLIFPEEKTFRPTQELLKAHRLHDETRILIGEFLADVRAQRELSLDGVQQVIVEMSASIHENPDPLVWLTHLKREDDYAYKHAIDCAVLLMSFGRHLGYARETLQTLGMVGLLQDVGKIRVPEPIRSRSGLLKPSEYKEAKRHVEYSIDILHTIPGLGNREKVLETVVQHHERMDGSGYPAALRGPEISPLACMAAIVDNYSALLSDRRYGEIMTIHGALTHLERWKGRHFHESLVEQFMQSVGIFPVGTLVELNSREIGVVVSQNRVRRLQPTVMLLLAPDRTPYGFPGMVNLALGPMAGDQPYRILRDLPPGSYDLDPTEFYIQAA
jgi:HD-GYP domain-containing protein (c-di-GMP phosphodiesterase class II)